MSEMMKNPKVMEEAQAEARRVCNSKGYVEETDTHQLIYLRSIIKETLRVHPPAPLLLPREALKDVKSMDITYLLRPGSSLMLGQLEEILDIGLNLKSLSQRGFLIAQLITKAQTLNLSHLALEGGFTLALHLPLLALSFHLLS